MELTVLGKYGPYAPAGGATSGYLLREGSTNLLIECGSGVLARLQQFIPIEQLSAVILSHLHSDHMSDMLILRYALQQIHPRSQRMPFKVIAPDEPRNEIALLRGQNVFEIITIKDDMRLRIGEFEISFHKMTHPVPSFGMLIYNYEKAMAYTGDTCMNDEVVPFSMGVDLLLADTGLLESEKGARPAHLSALEAGRIATLAGVKRLLCTHISPRTTDEAVREEAAREFPSAEVVQENMTYEI